MRIIARKALSSFWQQAGYEDAEQPLKTWFTIASNADWSIPADVKAQFGNASIIANNRVVFNIAGNKYRLVVAVNYNYRLMYIRFVGTHKEYDKIEVASI